jgi:hypothetical protein
MSMVSLWRSETAKSCGGTKQQKKKKAAVSKAEMRTKNGVCTHL